MCNTGKRKVEGNTANDAFVSCCFASGISVIERLFWASMLTGSSRLKDARDGNVIDAVFIYS